MKDRLPRQKPGPKPKKPSRSGAYVGTMRHLKPPRSHGELATVRPGKDGRYILHVALNPVEVQALERILLLFPGWSRSQLIRAMIRTEVCELKVRG